MSIRRPQFVARELGPATIATLLIAGVALWVLAKPADQPAAAFYGQLLGAEAILCLSIALVLISTLPWVELWFDGIDRAAIWHRRLAITGLCLLLPHVLLAATPDGTAFGGPLGVIGLSGMGALALWAILPRWQSVVPRPLRGLVLAARDAPGVRDALALFGGYERWRALHRTTGVFVAAGFAHGLLDGSAWDGAPILRWSYVAIGGIGLAFYGYRELLARHFLALHDYQVQAVHRLGDGLVEVVLRPLGRPVQHFAGQFAIVYLEGKDGWHRHPFTLASAPHEEVVRLTVKALGDYTSRLHDILEPGMPAVIGGPHGRFTHKRGTDRQIWVAGGVGVAPFLSWLRAFDVDPRTSVDFFYSSDGEPPFAGEIRAIAERHPNLRAHLIDTSVEGRLRSHQILATVAGEPRELSVFMCGPTGMLQTFQSELHGAGVPLRRIHREYFDWR